MINISLLNNRIKSTLFKFLLEKDILTPYIKSRTILINVVIQENLASLVVSHICLCWHFILFMIPSINLRCLKIKVDYTNPT